MTSAEQEYLADIGARQIELVGCQNKMIERQQKPLHEMAEVIERYGLAHLLDGTEHQINPRTTSHQKIVVLLLLGHILHPLYGMGNSDMIPIKLGGEDCKAFIFNNDMITYWNLLLNLSRKIPKHMFEYDEEFNSANDAYAQAKNYQALIKEGDNSEETAEALKHCLTINQASIVRQELVHSSLKRFAHTKKVINKRIAPCFRKALTKHHLRTIEDLSWIDELHKSNEAKYEMGASFDEHWSDEEVNEVPFDESLNLPPTPPESEDGDGSSNYGR